ncbi:MAG TPA: hypothetical protein VHD15_03075 [Hyphomicrobiales bacterium]|nr:hypothetical protein [Hyphomicrobiales bacterium]
MPARPRSATAGQHEGVEAPITGKITIDRNGGAVRRPNVLVVKHGKVGIGK